MCMGFHVGWFLMLLSPYTELFNFDVTIANFFILGWLSSGTSYILNMIFGDRGFQIGVEHGTEHLVNQVDASTGP